MKGHEYSVCEGAGDRSKPNVLPVRGGQYLRQRRFGTLSRGDRCS